MVGRDNVTDSVSAKVEANHTSFRNVEFVDLNTKSLHLEFLTKASLDRMPSFATLMLLTVLSSMDFLWLIVLCIAKISINAF